MRHRPIFFKELAATVNPCKDRLNPSPRRQMHSRVGSYSISPGTRVLGKGETDDQEVIPLSHTQYIRNNSSRRYCRRLGDSARTSPGVLGCIVARGQVIEGCKQKKLGSLHSRAAFACAFVPRGQDSFLLVQILRGMGADARAGLQDQPPAVTGARAKVWANCAGDAVRTSYARGMIMTNNLWGQVFQNSPKPIEMIEKNLMEKQVGVPEHVCSSFRDATYVELSLTSDTKHQNNFVILSHPL